MMKKSILILLFIFLTVSLFAQGGVYKYGKIDFLLGDVKVKRLSGSRINATVGMKVFVGDKVTTGKNSSAQILLGQGIKARLAAESEFELKKSEINKANEKETVLGLSFGKMWANIQKLKKDEKLNVETPTAVAGIRGTILVVDQQADQTTLYVGEGLVSLLSKIIGKDVEVDNGFVATIDKDGKISEPRAMTEDDKKNMMSGIPVMIKGGKGKSKKDTLKSEVESEKENLAMQQYLANKLQKEDLITGRTMKDIHGNLVRVEQLFRKSGEKSFQIINLTQRDDELVYFDINMYYNKRLPGSFKDWGEFFAKNDVNLQQRIALLGTKTKDGVKDHITWTGTYDAKDKKFNEQFVINGTTYYGDLDDDEHVDSSSSSKELKTVTEIKLYTDPSLSAGSDSGKILKMSLYIINNDGEVLSEKHFSSGNDILNLFNTTGGELIVSSDDLMQGDIDIVAIPDIAFVFIQEIF